MFPGEGIKDISAAVVFIDIEKVGLEFGVPPLL